MDETEFAEGDIVQVVEQTHLGFPCLLIVDEVELWGVRAFVITPANDETPSKKTFYKLPYGMFKKVGEAIFR